MRSGSARMMFLEGTRGKMRGARRVRGEPFGEAQINYHDLDMLRFSKIVSVL